MVREKSLESPESVNKALCVICPINSQNDLKCGQVYYSFKTTNIAMYYLQVTKLRLRCLLGHLLESLERDADREWPHPDCPAPVLHQLTHPVHAAAQTTGTAVNEVDTIVLNMETNEVTAEDALEDEVVPGEDPDDVPGREGDVQEETNLDGNLLLLRHGPDGGGRQHQVIVVDPHDGDVVRIL